MALSEFELKQRCLESAHSLPEHCVDDYLRLTRTLLHGPALAWLLVDAPQDLLRQRIMQALNKLLSAAGLRQSHLRLGGRRPSAMADFEADLMRHAQAQEVVHVEVEPGWLTQAQWADLNLRRERLAKGARARMVFWTDAPTIALASAAAPDFWAWRAGVYQFHAEPDALTLGRMHAPQLEPMPHLDAATMQERTRRIREIDSWLAAHPDAPDELKITPLHEQGQLLRSLGRLDEALAHWRERALPLYASLGREREMAEVRFEIARVLQGRGEWDEALRMYREDLLPTFEKLGDQRERAATMGQIADILEARGELSEALRIRREEVLPVFEKLGDQRSRAVTMGQIADILQARGELSEALRIRREEALPVFEKLGDQRERAVTMGKIADILQARGELSEALRIRREEELPVYEKLGDQHSRAMTMGKIADILQARGELSEALRICREEALPVFEKLGDQGSRAVTMGKIADILQARGELSEALRIRREEALPVFEKLGDQRSILVAQTNIAQLLLDRKGPSDGNEARGLLSEAYKAAKRLGFPQEQKQIRDIYKRAFGSYPGV